MALSHRQLNRMELSHRVQVQGHELPSLQEECKKRRLDTSGSRHELRVRLKRHKQVADQLQCPVCLEVPAADEFWQVCPAGHHVCFVCLMNLLRTEGCRRCPMRCDTFRLETPGKLTRDLMCSVAPVLYEVQRSSEYQLYLDMCGTPYLEASGDPESVERSITRFARVMGADDGESAVRRYLQTYQQLVASQQELALCEQSLAAATPSHQYFPSSSSSSSSSSSDDDDEDAGERVPAWLGRDVVELLHGIIDDANHDDEDASRDASERVQGTLPPSP